MRVFMFSAMLALTLDQASKMIIKATMKVYQSIPVIKGFFSITHIENSGISFGIFNQGSNELKRWLLVAAVGSAMLAIFIYWIKNRTRDLLFDLSWGIILGGAAGNLVDRVLTGRVTDFLEFSYRAWSFPVFNIADTCVSVGVGLIIIHTLFTPEHKNASHTV